MKHIQNVTDDMGHEQSILIYGKDDIRWGNMTFKTIKEAKKALTKKCRLNE